MKTRRAAQAIRTLRVDPDAVMRLIYETGMNPARLTEENLVTLQRELKKGAARSRIRSATRHDIVPQSTVVILRNDKEREDLYWLHGVEQEVPRRFHPIEDLYKLIAGKINYADLKPVVIDMKPGKPAPRRTSGRTKQKPFAGFVTESLMKYVMDHVEELRAFMHSDEYNMADIMSNEDLKQQLFETSIREFFENAGYKIKNIMKPEDLVVKAARQMRGKMAREIETYLKSPDAKATLDGFDVDNLNTHNSAREVIKRLRQRTGQQDVAFYVRCLETKYRGRFDDGYVPDSWALAANNAVLLGANKWAQETLPEHATGEEYALIIAKHFTKHQQEYRKGDSRRIFDGLYVDDRIEGSPDITSVRRDFGCPVNYLIVNYDGIDTIAGQVVARIHARTGQATTNKRHAEVYRQIRDGTLSVTSDNVNLVKAAFERQMLSHEKKAFESMKIPGEELSDTYRQNVIGFYLLAKGKDLLRYPAR